MSSTNFTYSPTTGNGNTNVAVNANYTNAGNADRGATITITNGVATKTVAIRQKYQPRAVQFASTHFPASGGSIYFTIHSEYDVVFRSVPNWITISDESGNTYAEGQRISSGVVDNKTFILTAAENTGESRTVAATFNMGHYIGNVLQQTVSYFSFFQDAAYRLVPLTFGIKNSGTIVWYHARTLIGDVGDLTIQYSKDGGATWSNLTSSTAGTSINVTVGDKVLLRGNNSAYGTLPLSYTSFSGSTATFEAYGNLMSLVDATGFTGITSVSSEYAFNRLFSNTNITDARNLIMEPTTVAAHAYTSMFQDCTQLVSSPELPAYTLTTNCYDEMFNGCSSLNYIRCYATSTAATNCTYNWVRNVAPTGTFVKASTMTTWTVGNNGIPTNWVVEDHTGPAPTYTWSAESHTNSYGIYGNGLYDGDTVCGFEVLPNEVEAHSEAVPFTIDELWFGPSPAPSTSAAIIATSSRTGQTIRCEYDSTAGAWIGTGQLDIAQGDTIGLWVEQ